MLKMKRTFVYLVMMVLTMVVLQAKEYDKTSYYVAYDSQDKTQFALVMPSVNKIYTHQAGHIEASDMKRVDEQFVAFPKYDDGTLCFSELKSTASGEGGAEVMANQCYEVKFFYTQKEFTDTGVAFMLFYAPADKVYEGLAGAADSFKVVREGAVTYNENSITHDNYDDFMFDIQTGVVKGVAKDGDVVPPAQKIIGKWKQSCGPSGDKFKTKLRIFDGTKERRIVRYFKDSECKVVDSFIITERSYQIGNATKDLEGNDATEINFTYPDGRKYYSMFSFTEDGNFVMADTAEANDGHDEAHRSNVIDSSWTGYAPTTQEAQEGTIAITEEMIAGKSVYTKYADSEGTWYSRITYTSPGKYEEYSYTVFSDASMPPLIDKTSNLDYRIIDGKIILMDVGITTMYVLKTIDDNSWQMEEYHTPGTDQNPMTSDYYGPFDTEVAGVVDTVTVSFDKPADFPADFGVDDGDAADTPTEAEVKAALLNKTLYRVKHCEDGTNITHKVVFAEDTVSIFENDEPNEQGISFVISGNTLSLSFSGENEVLKVVATTSSSVTFEAFEDGESGESDVYYYSQTDAEAHAETCSDEQSDDNGSGGGCSADDGTCEDGSTDGSDGGGSAGGGDTVAITQEMLSGKTFYLSDTDGDGYTYYIKAEVVSTTQMRSREVYVDSGGTIISDESLTFSYTIQDGKWVFAPGDDEGEVVLELIEATDTVWTFVEGVMYLSKPADYPASL